MSAEPLPSIASAWDRLVHPGDPTPPPCTDPRCAAARHTAADREERQRHHADDLEADNAQLRRAAARVQRLHRQAPNDETGYAWCEHCLWEWPCETAEAMSGITTHGEAT